MDFRLDLSSKDLKSKGAVRIPTLHQLITYEIFCFAYYIENFTGAETPYDYEMPKDDALGTAFVVCDLENDYFSIALILYT